MAGTVRTYYLPAVALSLGGIPISGLADEGVITVEFASDNAESRVGGDGEVQVDLNADDRAFVTLTLMESSRAVRLIDEKYRDAEATVKAGGAYPNIAFSMFDNVNGDAIDDAQCVLLAKPPPSKGLRSGNRAWRFLLPNGRANARLAQSVG